ncbi:hypothetical protein OHA10_12330 [Kribbella sp. NBC_00662]|uniref:hypothetical protein n=1 Tax=Kribbella sp. NBC_00662 TaxID=2975969 RepID=UPI0032565096
MSGPNEDLRRRMALVGETDAVKQLLSRSIASIGRRGSVEVDPYATLQLLSQAIERLLKLTIMFQHHRAHGELAAVRSYGHRVDRLATVVFETAWGYRDSNDFRVLDEDLEFAANDPTLQLLLDACAEFSSGGRYHHLDVAAGGMGDPARAPKVMWDAIEQSALADDSDLLSRMATLDYRVHEEALQEINLRIIAVAQRYIRFIARLWAFSPTGDLGRQHSGSLQAWLMLNDDQLRTPCNS